MNKDEKQKLIKRMKDKWASIELKQRSERADAIKEFCSWGLSIREVAGAVGINHSTVIDYLDLSVANEARGLTDCKVVDAPTTPTVRDVRDMVSHYGPDEPDESYVEEYEQKGFTSEVAARLSRSYEAADAAIEAGVLQEAHKQAQEKTDAVLFGPAHKWNMDLQRLCNQVKAAARTLNDAKISDLKKVGSRKQIASAHAKWMEQIERIQNFHPDDFDVEVQNNAS